MDTESEKTRVRRGKFIPTRRQGEFLQEKRLTLALNPGPLIKDFISGYRTGKVC